MKKIIITGATGVIGMALINKCIEDKIYATVLVNPNSARVGRIPNSVYINVIPCGVDEYDKLLDNDRLPEEFYVACESDVFYHLAWKGTFGEARNDMALQEKNIEYTLNAVRLANKLGVKTFVGVGSQAEYGRVEGLLSADTPCNPENGYGIAKLKAGNESRKMCRDFGIKHIWTRVLSVYGPYDGDKTMVMSTLDKLQNGIKPSLTKGEQMWDYLYSSDAARALIMLGDNGKDGTIYPIGSGKARPLREYIETMRDEVNKEAELGFGEIPYSDKQVMYLCADISALQKDVGFEPEVSFDQGIKLTLEYINMRDNISIDLASQVD